MSKQLTIWIFLAGLILFIPSCWQRDRFPHPPLVAPELLTEPRQEAVEKEPFSVHQEGVEYRISPLYEYALYGQVVSFRFHDSRFGLHRAWNDHLNVADLCVVWGDNLNPDLNLNRIKFWNGQFTCNFSTRNREAWDRFDIFQISNNHLILDDPHLRRQLSRVRIGDQIHIRGWLAEYAHSGGRRGTSTTRLDTGDGACETIFVQDYQLIAPTRNRWRGVMYFALLLLLTSATIATTQILRGKWKPTLR